jgi:hypothetical protein
MLLGGAVGSAITGTSGNDAILGSSSGESISGGLGNDSMTGGGGTDVFHVGAGNDVIKDFAVGVDKLFIDVAHDDEVLTFNSATNTTTLSIKSGASTIAEVSLEGGDFTGVPMTTLLDDDPNHA